MRTIQSEVDKWLNVVNIPKRQAEEQRLQAELQSQIEEETRKITEVEQQAEEEVKQFVDHTEETDVDDVVNNVFEEKNIIPQSEEVDEYGNHFVLSSDGSFDFGLVDAKSGLQQSPIRLSMGENIVDEDGNNHGYGLLHIEAERGDKIREAGYKSVQDFVENVAKNYTTIKEGNVIANNQTYLLELVDDHNNTLFIQLSKNGEYWTVNSAGIFRKKYSRNKRKVFDRPAIDPDINTDISGVDSDHSDGVVTPAGNSPNLSTNKGSENAQDNKGNLQKNAEADKQQEEKQKVKHHKATVQNGVSEKEVAVRDAIVDMVRKSRDEVVTNNEDAQRLLDWANDVRLEAKRKSALEIASLGNNPRSLTVISSADGAKVLKNLDNLLNTLVKSATQPKTFLGDVAKALGASTKGSSSQYATFEAKNGKIVTIRLSNHNATVSNFDKVGEEEGISIVVSPKENEGILNDGNAHVIEYFYDSIKLRKADGKPLAEIVRSIKQTLYSGEFKDTTGLAKRQEVNNPLQLREHRVYHGSGAEFDAFDHSHMGEGEGSQVFGWGTYVTESELVGRGYLSRAKSRSAKRVLNVNLSKDTEDYLIKYLYGEENIKNALSDLRVKVDAAMRLFEKYGEKDYDPIGVKRTKELHEKLPNIRPDDIYVDDAFMYVVDIPEDNGENYIPWHEPCTDAQINRLIKFLKKERWTVKREGGDFVLSKGRGSMPRFIYYGMNGEELYDEIASNEKDRSELLSNAGFVGIKYPVGTYHGGPEDAKNYVIFNERDAQITDRIRFFRTPNGEAYGFTVGGKIYIDTRIATAETPIHEYSHLWAQMLREQNPKEWANIVNLMKGTPIWNEIKGIYTELKTDDEIADEVLAHYSGKRGAEKLRAEEAKVKEGNTPLSEKIKAIGAIERVRKALHKFWKGVADTLGIHFTTAEEVADRVMYDLLSGLNPNNVSGENGKTKELIAVHNISDENLSESDEMYRIREEEPPTKTGIGYKVFVLKNGELYPPMVANPNGEATPVGVWLDADAAPIIGQTKTGRNQVKAGGKGTQGGSGELAYRPGWHLGEIPYALQFNRKDENGNKTLFPANFVWAEVEYADDVDYQEEAMSYGYSNNGKFRHSYAGLPKLPKNGSYKYRTNPNPETDPWIITGAMRVNRLLTPTEVDEIVKEAGREPQQRQEGAITDAEINQLNEQINSVERGNADNDHYAEVSNDDKAEHAQQLAERLHLDNVEIVTSDMVVGSEKRKQAKGIYSKSTGKITIIVDNNSDLADIEQTLLHEAVAHYGLRKLFGDEYNAFLDDVYRNVDAPTRAKISRLAYKNNWNLHTATEEYLASLAEDTNFETMHPTMWDKIRTIFNAMLRKVGFTRPITDNEIRYQLWRSYQNLLESRDGTTNYFMAETKDNHMQQRLGVGEFARTSKFDNLPNIHISDKAEYAELASAINTNGIKKPKKGVLYDIFTADNYYIYTSNGYGNFKVRYKMPIDGNEDFIKKINSELNGTTKDFKRISSLFSDGGDVENADYNSRINAAGRHSSNSTANSMGERGASDSEGRYGYLGSRLSTGSSRETGYGEISKRAEGEETELTDIDNPYYQPDILGEELYLDAVASEKPLTEKDEDVLLRPASIMNGEPTWDERNESFSEYARRYAEWAHDKQVYENISGATIPPFPRWNQDEVSLRDYMAAFREWRQASNIAELAQSYGEEIRAQHNRWRRFIRKRIDEFKALESFYKYFNLLINTCSDKILIM